MNSIDQRLERLQAATRISHLLEVRKRQYLTYHRQKMRALQKLIKLAEGGNEYARCALDHIGR